MQGIQIIDKTFIPYITNEELEQAIKRLATIVHNDYKGEIPVFIGVLNGVIIFMSDFLKQYKGDCEISFLQMKSYEGTQTTGNVKTLMDISMDITGRHIVLMEDIVDTGNTLYALHQLISRKKVKSIRTATLLYKPDAYKKDLNIDYIGMHIPDKFVVGFGLDYEGLGRNLPDIYQLKD
ncbi:hypoxanthine phosphoribosyltransferase [Flavobacteriaceae bacterium Ap0902]|nr:hypoxanthine phosphoribosyltransferase [Flavobacteriaceae bacterium Ap0902]